MGFDEAKGRTLIEVVAELTEDYGTLGYELIEDIENPWRRERDPDVIKLHRLWMASIHNGTVCICAADIEEYDKPPHAYKLIALESGPWGPRCPSRILKLRNE